MTKAFDDYFKKHPPVKVRGGFEVCMSDEFKNVISTLIDTPKPDNRDIIEFAVYALSNYVSKSNTHTHTYEVKYEYVDMGNILTVKFRITSKVNMDGFNV